MEMIEMSDPNNEVLEINSIINSIKKKLGAGEDYTYFDHDILTEINSSFATLYQLGVGTKTFIVESEDDTWDDYFDEVNAINRHSLEHIKEYVYLSVKLIFDPPESSFLIDALSKKKDEMEWRIFLDEDILE